MDGPDHLVAVATIVTRERPFVAGACAGLLWGIGPTVTLAARLGRLRRMREAMAIASGLAAIVFGCWYAARLV
jgi:hypothetical protein